jgi:Ser/Thr protein kinase RdoA (MazF antagonist)
MMGLADATAQAAEGLAFDHAVPFRQALLDPDRVAEAFRAQLGRIGPVAITGCVLERAKYRVGESLRVVYRVHLEGGRSAVVAGRTVDGPGGLARAAAAVVPAGDLRPVWHDPVLGVLWWTFPNDRYLRGLDDLRSPGAPIADLLRAHGTWSSSELVALTPGRSAVLRALDDSGATLAYAKVYAPGTTSVASLAALYSGVAAGLRTASVAGARVVAPRALGWDADRDLLLLEPVGGTSWVGQPADAVERSMTRLGRSIAVLHDIAPPEGTALRRFVRLEPQHLPQAARVIGTARPDVAATVDGLARRLIDSAPRPVAEDGSVLLHGDCHPGNLLSTGSGVALIDLDQAGMGPAGADLASLVARLRQEELIGELTPGAADRLLTAFFAGYTTVRGLPDPAVLAWHTAAALLLERALRAVNRVHPQVLPRVPDLLDQAHASLTDGVPA